MRICAVGDYDSICGFAALGIDIYQTLDKEEIKKIIESYEVQNYAVILITENAAAIVSDTIAKYEDSPLPAIIPIPTVKGEYTMGMDVLKKAVERAVGSAEMVF